MQPIPANVNLNVFVRLAGAVALGLLLIFASPAPARGFATMAALGLALAVESRYARERLIRRLFAFIGAGLIVVGAIGWIVMANFLSPG